MSSCLQIDNTGRIVAFAEKPSGDDLKAMEVDTTVLGLSAEDAKASPYIASMGIYVFKKKVLLELLNDRFPTCNDFGSEVITTPTTTSMRETSKERVNFAVLFQLLIGVFLWCLRAQSRVRELRRNVGFEESTCAVSDTVSVLALSRA